MLQVEHRTTEKLTEQIERRVGSESNSLDSMSVTSSKESDRTEEKKEVFHKQPMTSSEQILRVNNMVGRCCVLRIFISIIDKTWSQN